MICTASDEWKFKAYQRPVEETTLLASLQMVVRIITMMVMLFAGLREGAVHVQVTPVKAHGLWDGGGGSGGQGIRGRLPLVHIVNPVLVRVVVGRWAHGD